MPKIAVIGGGLAGLTAAFYLSKNQEFDIEIYEANEILGGRVQTVDVDGFRFNTGAFMIFPWYKSFHRLLHDLRYTPTLDHINLNKEYAWSNKSATFHEINSHWTFDDAEVITLIKSMPNFLTHAAQLYNPDPNRFNGISVKEYVQQLNPEDVNALDVVNRLIVGYTYGAIGELPLTIYFGFAKEILMHSGFKHVRMIRDGADRIVQSLQDSLAHSDVEFNLSSKVTVSDDKFFCGDTELSADHYVIATAENNILENFTKPIIKPIEYNDHFVALIRTNKSMLVNNEDSWNLLYTGSLEEEQPQLTCIANLSNSIKNAPANAYLTYLRIPPGKSHEYNDDFARQEVRNQFTKYFGQNETLTIKSLKHWKHTMPIIGLDAMKKIQSVQGSNNVYFAGDYLGAPSMEVAIKSGVEVAAIINRSNK